MKTTLLFFIFSGILCSIEAQTPAWWPENGQTLSNLHNINFADNNTGWFFGDSTIGAQFKRGIIMKTTNQGVTWTAQNMGSDSIQILSSYIFNTSTVIAVGKFQTTGNGAVIKTIDGGTTWTRDTTSNSQRLFDVDFASSNVGWVVGRNGYLAGTNNGGTSWATQITGTGVHLYSVDFIDLNNGWAVGADPGTGGTVIHSINGGTNWTAQTNAAAGHLFAIQAFSPSRAIAVGAGGRIIVTNNSGNTWTTLNSGTTQDLFDVSFVNVANGWAAGVGGTIIMTTDSGNTWFPQASGTTNNINSIHMNNTGLGWYCGNGGKVYFYGNSPAGINQNTDTENGIVIYPNPSSGNFTIISNVPEESEMKIYNTLGECVGNRKLHFGENQIYISNQPKGVYFITIIYETGKSYKQKIVIQ